MKFGYRDRIILLIVCVVVIFAVGIFVFIKPKWETLSRNQETYETNKADWDAKKLEFDRIGTYQDTILKKHDQGVEVAKNFTETKMDSIAMDEFLRANFLNTDKNISDGVEVRGTYSVTNEKTATLNYYYYSPSIVTYPLYEAADLDGSLKKAAEEKRKDADILSARTSQSVGCTAAEFTLLINREDTMTVLDAIKNYADTKKDAMMVRSVKLREADFNENIEDEDGTHEETYIDENGEEQTRVVPNEKKNGGATDSSIKKDFTEVTVAYEVYYLQEPTTPDVGPKYEAGIWDTEEWRTKVAVQSEQ